MGQIVLGSILILGLLIVCSIALFRHFNIKNLAWPLAISHLIFGTGYHFVMWETYMMAQGKLALIVPLGITIPISLLSYMFTPFGSIAFLTALTLLGSIQFFFIGNVFSSPKQNHSNNAGRVAISRASKITHTMIRYFKSTFLIIMDYKNWKQNRILHSIKNLFKQ